MNRLPVWILDHLGENLAVEQMAAQVNMSPRNFVRVFGREFHMTPGEYLDRVRVEAARKQLENTNETIEKIAAAVGFVSSSTMRRPFHRVLDVTPSDYRARFRPQPSPSKVEPVKEETGGSISGCGFLWPSWLLRFFNEQTPNQAFSHHRPSDRSID
jgi:AraC-like DNA-binding protein